MLRVTEQKSGQVIFTWALGRDEQGVLRLVLSTVTNVQIPKGVELRLGNGTPRIVPYTMCDTQQCQASNPVENEMRSDILANGDASVTITAVNGQAINFKIPTKGADKVLAALAK